MNSQYIVYGFCAGQNESPQEVPLWYADCFALKATVAAGSREVSVSISPHPLNYLEEF